MKKQIIGYFLYIFFILYIFIFIYFLFLRIFFVPKTDGGFELFVK